MSVTHAQSERDFASNYLTLLSVSDASSGFASDYKTDPRDLRGIGVKLPPLPVVKKTSTSSNEILSSTCKCSFKSIKAPKFNISIDAQSSDTIYQVKAALCEITELAGYTPASIKLLVKGRVIQDGTLLRDITGSDEEIKFTALIGPKPDPVAETTPQEKELPWAKISLLLESEGFDGTATVWKLKSGWNMVN